MWINMVAHIDTHILILDLNNNKKMMWINVVALLGTTRTFGSQLRTRLESNRPLLTS
jgi:hypothetical protein